MRFAHLFRALVLGGAALSGLQCGPDGTDPMQQNQMLGNENPDGGTGGGTAHTGTGGGTSHATGGGGGTLGDPGGRGGVGPW